jgi:protein arginine kinase
VNSLFERDYVKWADRQGIDSDSIVISSRVRLARNLAHLPFPHMLNRENGSVSLQLVNSAWEDQEAGLDRYDYYMLQDLSPLEQMILMEKHLVSPQFLEQNTPWRAFLSDQIGSCSVMINEEDHIRMQCLLPGLQLQQCYELADGLDNCLESRLDYAFDENIGYLTACPTNVGTGIRASVMLHLPAIQMAGQMNHIVKNIMQVGMTVRGLYGEGSQALGNIFQVSNQVTLGQSEADIYNYLHMLTLQLVEQERSLRQRLYQKMQHEICNQVTRAYGLLRHAHMMGIAEALSLLSDLRFGVDLGVISGIASDRIDGLIVAVSPAHLQRKAGAELNAMAQDCLRMEIIKTRLTAGEHEEDR